MPLNPKTKLAPFQLEGARGIYKFRGRALLADEQGLGKTIQALYWIDKIPKCRPVLIICPASVKYNWQTEAMLHFNMRTEVLEGNLRKKNYRLQEDVVIINYNILKSWMKVIKKWNPQCIIIDEVQYIKSLLAQRTLHVWELTDQAKSVVGLSGTPMTNRPVELWPVLRAINPKIFPDFKVFAWDFCKPRHHPRYGWMFDGATKTKKLHRILKRRCMIRRLKKNVLPELPTKRRRFACFPLERKAMKVYEEAENNFLGWLRKKSPSRAKKARRAQALAKIGYLSRLAAELKLKHTIKWIEEFFECNPGEKLVAFTGHTFVIDAVKKHFGDSCVVIDGRVTGKARHDAVLQFKLNRKKTLFLGNWIAAGVGITLVTSRTIAALDFPWTPGDLLQGEDRAHRIGQKFKTWVYYLAALGTVEEKKIKVLHRKSKVLNAILDGTQNANDLDILNELLKEFKK